MIALKGLAPNQGMMNKKPLQLSSSMKQVTNKKQP
jgi:hypothetical protein